MFKKFRVILALFLLFNVASAQVQISEIAWMGTLSSSYDEWIELYNSSDNLINLDNWNLSSNDGSPNIELAGEIPAKNYFLLERTDDDSVPNIEADQIYIGNLKNTGEILILKNNDEIIDQTPTGDWVAGENSAKKTMERGNFSIFGAEKSAWQTFQGLAGDILGTPRAKNSGDIVIPLPENLEFVSNFEKVEITKINPVQLDSGDAWLEFSILSDSAVDITDWQISNTNTSQKLSELAESLVLISDSDNFAGFSVHLNNQGLAKISEQDLAPNFILPEDRLIFSAKNEGDLITFAIKSDPLDLAEDKTFQITNDDEVLVEKVFAKYLQIIISEISPNNSENDFFELFVKKADGLVDLKNMEIRHNGKTLFFAENELLVQQGDLLSFNLLSEKIREKPRKYINTTILQETGETFSWEKGTKNGIVASSGTMEVILWSGTSWENPAKSTDFICWADKKLNKTETKRLAANKPQNWGGDCFASDKLSKDESIARTEPQTDTNNSRDFYHHLHGSLGEKNFTKNHQPHARIKLQSGEFRGKSRVNFTGRETDNSASTDGDGLADLKKFQWEINGKSCGDFAIDGWNWVNDNCYLEAQKYNPSYMYFDFENFVEFEVSLRVTDLAGFSDTAKITISREKKIIDEEIKKTEFNYKIEVASDFFAEFLAQTDLVKLKELAYAEIQPAKIEPAPRYLFARDRFSAEERSAMSKNIGLIFQ